LTALDGSKTYISVFLLAAYSLWEKSQGREPDPAITSILIAAIGGSLRHAVGKTPPASDQIGGTTPQPKPESKAIVGTAAISAALLMASLIGITGLTGCAGLSPERTAYVAVGAELDAVDAAAKAYSALYIQQEAKNEANPTDPGYGTRKDDLVREQGKFNALLARYQAAHKSALRLYLAAKAVAQPGQTLSTDLHAWSDDLAKAEAEIIAFCHGASGQ
jgi:hypothetical protein